MQAKFRIGQTIKIKPNKSMIAFEAGHEMIVKDLEPILIADRSSFIYTLDTGWPQTESTNWLTNIEENFLECST